MWLQALTEVGMEAAWHLIPAPGYFVLRFVLRRPRDRVSYDDASTVLLGLLGWLLLAVGAVLLWRAV